MKSKLGIYIQSLDSFDALDWALKARPRIMVSMDHNFSKWRAIKIANPAIPSGKASPFTFVMGRHYFSDDEQRFDDPIPAAQRCFRIMLPEMQQMRGIYDCWMATNEPVIKTPDEAKRLSLFYTAWGDLMRAAGFRSVAYSFGVGNPDLALWPYLLDGLRHCDFIGLHEYSAPTMQADSGWNCLRFPKVWSSLPEDAKRLIIIGECGVDGGVLGNAHAQEGWRKFGDVNQYLWSLRWYDDEIQLYPYVVGAAIFQGGDWGKDGSFGMGNEPAIRDYIGAEGDPAPFILRDRAFAAAAVLTRQFERFAATPTPDGKRFTIGYGHTIWPGESYTRITLIEAEALLVQDQHRFAQALERLVKVPLSDNQYGALLDFIYNVGVTGFGTSDLLRKLNAGDPTPPSVAVSRWGSRDLRPATGMLRPAKVPRGLRDNYAGAAEEFARWKYGRNAKGEKVILPGLIKRRAAERELFLKS